MAKDNPDPPAQNQWAKVSPRETIRQHFFPDVTLTTHEGKKVRFYEDLLKNKCVTLNFMYTHCQGICSPVTSNLLKAPRFCGIPNAISTNATTIAIGSIT